MILDSFRKAGGWSQFFMLIGLAVMGAMIGGFFTVFVTIIWTGGDLLASTNMANQSYGLIQANQIISVIFTFLLPAIAFAYLFSEKPQSYLKIQSPSSPIFWILTILFLVAGQSLVSATAYYNEQLVLPESMAAVDKIMQSFAELNKSVMTTLLSNDSIGGIILNLFVIAVMAAIVEEFFFRGCLQQIMIKITKNAHVGIWITAIIFSAIHLDIYGFVPRILLGAGLGYLFVWTGNIWYPVLAHFLNNAAVVLLQQLYYKTPELEENDFNWSNDLWYVIGSVIGIAVIIFLFNKFRTKATPSNPENIN